MKVAEIMRSHTRSISPDLPVQAAAQCLRDLDIGSLPVCEAGRVVGMVTDRDIVVRGMARSEAAQWPVRNVMTIDVVKATRDQDVVEVAALMEARQIRRVPVVDDHDRLVGIVSLGDIALQAKPVADHVLEEMSRPRPDEERDGAEAAALALLF